MDSSRHLGGPPIGISTFFKLPLVKGQFLDDWLSNQFQIKYQADKEKK
jgi:hypothetical protein